MATTNLIKTSFFNDASNNLKLDYNSVLKNISEFRRSGGKTSQISFDGPQTYYFKILFYFDNNTEASPSTTIADLPVSNLLGLNYDGSLISGLPWKNGKALEPDHVPRLYDGYFPVNTALNYLLVNYEWDRARKLTEFITLLSDISYKYPWYFQTISGLDGALTRKEVMENEFKLEERKSIQIKCLQDAEDNKIGRLLDLYRDIIYSQEMHRMILPANLRKFDMGIFIFSRPLSTLHRNAGKKDILVHPESSEWDTPQSTKGDYASFKPNFEYERSTQYETSYKYIELHNCEFDYNSSASGYNDLKNSDGFKQEYTITVFFDNAFENRYDEWTMRNIGDFSIWDLNLNTYEREAQEDVFWEAWFQSQQLKESEQMTKLTDRTNLLKYKGDSSKTVEEKDSESFARESSVSMPNSAKTGSTSAPEGVGTALSEGNTSLSFSKSDFKSNTMSQTPLGILEDRTKGVNKSSKGIFTNSINQMKGYVKTNYIDPKVKQLKKMVFGNFYAVQFKNLKGSLKSFTKGDVLGGYKKAKKFVNGWKQMS